MTTARGGLAELAAAFVADCHRYDPDITDLTSLIEDTGGAGLCWDVSAAFATFAREHGADARVIWVLPFDSIANHAVALVDGHIVDHTARQFDEQAPFPLVATRDGYMRWFARALGGAPWGAALGQAT